MSKGFSGFHGRDSSMTLISQIIWQGGVGCVKFLVLLALVLGLANCGFLFSGKGNGRSYVVKGKRYYILASAKGFKEKGLASWYGEPFHGRRTASGEIYDMDKISAAHKTLPLHTWVEIRNLENKQVMYVRINDRGPFISGRVIDLSRAAARELGVYGPGLAKVYLKAVTGRKAQQLAAVEQARLGLSLLAQMGRGGLGGEAGTEAASRLALGSAQAPSAGDGDPEARP